MFVSIFFNLCILTTFTHPVRCAPGGHLFSRDSDVQSPRSLAELGKRLSSDGVITYNVSSVPRWSEFGAPRPGALVNVATEKDVEATNKFNLNENGIVINLRGLNKVTFNQDRTRATIQGGAIVKEVIDAAYAADAQVVTGNCNCVGALGAGLGGGYGNLVGLSGFSIDNYLALNVVLADGNTKTITPKDEDLWWALRGAAPNFGIVTSVVIKSSYLPKNQNTAWTGILLWREDQLESLIQAIQNLHLKPKMNIFLYYLTSGAPDYSPTIATTVWYYGSEAEGRREFDSILSLHPVQEMVAVTPYNQWNTGGDIFCTKGGRKPSFGVGHNVLDTKAWRGVWEEYKQFVTSNPDTGSSAVLVECYSHDIVDKNPASSFANRDVRFNSVIIPWYYDKSLDERATQFCRKARDLVRKTDGFPNGRDRTYINFASGDESNEIVYQDALPRLRRLKSKYDPQNVFRHWFPIRA